MYKICITCKENKELNCFTKREKSIDGYRNQCKDCRTIYLREHYEKNKEIILTKNREYRLKSSDKLKENKSIYYQLNKERLNKNKNRYNKERRDKDFFYKLKGQIRSLIGNSIRRNGYSKESKTINILGCEFEEFKIYLESKFEPWMSWENYGLYNGELNYGWDIDHITPVSIAESEDHIIKLNHYTNLQPLCSKFNRDIKVNKVNV
jgi:hypothetical protein